MEKLDKSDGQSMDIVADNIAKLKELFPEILTENKIDFTTLQALLGEEIEADDERYSFNWHGKAQARRLAQSPSTGTLRPCRGDSVDWNATQNLFIEGDNLEVLKLLQKSYHKRVKMIYIDPPYNTGKDFVYPDNFRDNIKNYLELTGQTNSGKKISPNTDASGRFHTDWLNMMYPRLKLARNLLSDDGVVFISIDDNEASNLKLICDEIFGAENFMATIVRSTGTTTGQGSSSLGKSFDYMHAYSKQPNFEMGGVPLSEKDHLRYNLEDENGKFSILQLRRTGGQDRREDRPSMYFGLESPDKSIVFPTGPSGYESRWRVSKSRYNQMVKDNLIYWKQDDDNKWTVYFKYYLEGRTKRASNLWTDIEGNKKGSIDVRNLLGDKIFDTPKPIELIKRAMQIACDENSIVLDFFAGSSTTAHAVMTLNSEDNGNRHFIMVQLQEPCSEDGEAYKAGYKSIAEIGKERIRRAAKKIKADNQDYQGDLGFKVFKLDSSNLKPWDADFDSLAQDLAEAAEVVKAERSAEDVLFEILLKYGLDLTLPIATHILEGKTIYEVGAGALVVCLDSGITEAVAEAIGKLKETLEPEVMRVVFKDSGFANDAAKVNAVQVLKQFGIDDVKSI